MVQVHSVPRRPSRRSDTRWEVHRGHESWRGNVTVPQSSQTDPISSGSWAVPPISPSATGTKSRWPSIGLGLWELEHRGARAHVAPHPAVGVQLGDRQEGADPLAVVVAGLAQGELDIAVDTAEHHVVRPAVHVAQLDEAAQLLEAADELAAAAVVAGGPLDRELDVRGDHLERAVRIGAVEALEVAFEEGHATLHGRMTPPGSTPITASARSLKNSAIGSSVAIPPGRYHCQTLLYSPRTARVSNRVSLSGITPRRIASARKLSHADLSSRARARACWRACSSRADVRGLARNPCSQTSTRLRRTSCSVRSKQSCSTAAQPWNGSCAPVVSATKRARKSSIASSMIT